MNPNFQSEVGVNEFYFDYWKTFYSDAPDYKFWFNSNRLTNLPDVICDNLIYDPVFNNGGIWVYGNHIGCENLPTGYFNSSECIEYPAVLEDSPSGTAGQFCEGFDYQNHTGPWSWPYGCTTPVAYNFDNTALLDACSNYIGNECNPFSESYDGLCEVADYDTSNLYITTFEYEFHAGANLISMPIYPVDPESGLGVGGITAFGRSLELNSYIKDDNGEFTVPFNALPLLNAIITEGLAATPNPVLGWVGSLETINPTDGGYWIKFSTSNFPSGGIKTIFSGIRSDIYETGEYNPEEQLYVNEEECLTYHPNLPITQTYIDGNPFEINDSSYILFPYNSSYEYINFNEELVNYFNTIPTNGNSVTIGNYDYAIFQPHQEGYSYVDLPSELYDYFIGLEFSVPGDLNDDGTNTPNNIGGTNYVIYPYIAGYEYESSDDTHEQWFSTLTISDADIDGTGGTNEVNIIDGSEYVIYPYIEGYEYEPTSGYVTDFLTDLTNYYTNGSLDTWLFDNYSELLPSDDNYIPTQLSSVFEALAGSQISYFDIYIQGGFEYDSGQQTYDMVMYPINDERFWPVDTNEEFIQKVELAFPEIVNANYNAIFTYNGGVQKVAQWSPFWSEGQWFFDGDFTTNFGGALTIVTADGGTLNWTQAIEE